MKHNKKFKHPLSPFVTELFTSGRTLAIDVPMLAGMMGAPTKPAHAAEHFRTVALDVLEVMRFNGEVWRDSDGWYRVAVPGTIDAMAGRFNSRYARERKG